MSFEIRLVIDPERRLQRVGTTEVRWDIGEKCMEFESKEAAYKLMARFSKWGWGGTEVAKLVRKEKKK